MTTATDDWADKLTASEAARREAEERARNCNGRCDIALARRQVGPDGIVPGNANECAHLWEQEAARLKAALASERAAREKAERERDEYRVAWRDAVEQPCPYCHTRRAEFRCGDQGFGEEDFDMAHRSQDGKPCDERVLRVAAESRAARAEAALREILYSCANGYYGPDGHDYATEAKRVARAALAGQEVGRG